MSVSCNHNSDTTIHQANVLLEYNLDHARNYFFTSSDATHIAHLACKLLAIVSSRGLVQFKVVPLFGHEFIVRTPFHYFASCHDHYNICIPDDVQSLEENAG